MLQIKLFDRKTCDKIYQTFYPNDRSICGLYLAGKQLFDNWHCVKSIENYTSEGTVFEIETGRFLIPKYFVNETRIIS